jgi:hypothetical protein
LAEARSDADEFHSDLWFHACYDVVSLLAAIRAEYPMQVESDAVEEHVKAQFDTNARVRFIEMVKAKGRDPKNDALYLDPEPDWSLQVVPDEITKAVAHEWASLAHHALQAGSPTIYEIVGE